MNRKKYIFIIIALAVAGVGLIVTNAIWEYLNWLWIAIIALTGWTVLRTSVLAPLQLFGTKFTMLVDYDLEIAEACRLAKEGMDNAPTQKVKAIYQMYYGMGLYYAGDYEGAIRNFNLLDMRRLEGVYHVLIVAFISYSAFEIGDEQTFKASLERLRTIHTALGPKYQTYAANYLEILEALDSLASDPEKYRVVMDKHFSRNDGYISTRLIHNYRLALYDRQLGDFAEMDKKLAFVIANGKEHHTALRAKSIFRGSVNVEDYVIKETPEDVVPADAPVQIETAEAAKPAPKDDRTPKGE